MAGFGIDFRFNDKDKDKLASCSKKFRSTVRKHLSRQYLGFSSYAVGQVKREIRNGSFPGGIQGPAQQIIKGHSNVLVLSHGLENSIGFKYVNEPIELGIEVIVKDRPVSSSISMVNLAKLLHEGRRWKPTVAQRKALVRKIMAKGGDPPEGPSLKRYVIPPRPFMLQALRRPEVTRKFAEAVIRATDKTFEELLPKGK